MTTRSIAKVVRVFLNADMRCSQPGLAAMAAEAKVKVSDLQYGDYLVFINGKKNKIKIYAGGDVLAYYRMNKGEHLDMRVIQKIPQAFMGSGKINYNDELRALLQAELAKRKPRVLEMARAMA